MSKVYIPMGFVSAGWNAGIKDSTLDFGVLHSKVPGAGAAIFTKNNYPGNPVIVGREHVKKGKLQTIVVNSKNANVSTGPGGLELAYSMCKWTGESLGVKPEHVLPSSTGVIGRPMPADKVKSACQSISSRLKENNIEEFASAIMTTDTFPKLLSFELKSGIRILGVAKGAGMIEPNMATMLSYMITDADISPKDLNRLLLTVAERSFNRISVDTDTSTSDTFASIANGMSGVKVQFTEKDMEDYNHIIDPFLDESLDLIIGDDHSREFVRAFSIIALELAKMIARDGEGATKLIQVKVENARDRSQAVKIARSIVNSPLVKTAVYGSDPNWGRIVMAIGKVFDEPVPYEKLEVFIGDIPLKDADEKALKECAHYLNTKEVLIRVSLNMGHACESVWGCDLTEGYVKINAHYTT